MTLAISLRVKLLVLVGALAVAAFAAAAMVLARRSDSGPAQTKASAPAPAAHAATRPAAAKTVAATTAKPALAAAAPAAPARAKKATPGAQLPAPIRQALAANKVVVVSLYTPKAKVDATAMREASAGARLAGATFVPVDVATHAVDSLHAHFGVIEDPAVLVLRPPGNLIVRIDGFADRDTVAQAVANATP